MLSKMPNNENLKESIHNKTQLQFLFLVTGLGTTLKNNYDHIIKTTYEPIVRNYEPGLLAFVLFFSLNASANAPIICC